MTKLIFSIGICAYNEKDGIKQLLSHLVKENYYNILDSIMVVSSASTDGTDEVVRSFRDDRIKLILEKKRNGKYTAVNEIIRRAKSRKTDVLVMIPADVVPKIGAVDALVSTFRNEQVGCVSAKPVVRNTDSFVEKVGQALWAMHNETFLYHSENENVTHATGEMMAVRTKIMEELPRIIVDDAYMAGTVLKKGFDILYNPSAEVSIWVPRKIGDLWKQRKRNLQGLKHLKTFDVPVQTLTYANPLIVLLMISRVIRKSPGLIPYITVIGLIELLGALFAMLPRPQTVAWDMVTTAKPKLELVEPLIRRHGP